ncbi:MAG TPA: PilZ domain-containing protein [Pyrinomonadaceae bacterium]
METEERRRAPRAKVNLPARWEGVLSQQQASVTNLSLNGCFLLSGGSIEVGELIRLEITLPDNDHIYPWAEVVEDAGEIGFAVRFTMMDDVERERLDRYIDQSLEA